jgi:eukaryotic-like serine/threonine-protein kinase
MTDSDERLGRTVGGKYRIVKLLGAGGMGVVYEALHVIVKRRFAVKFLRADLALRRDVLQRFQREAEAAGALENEHIAAAVDFGIAADGAPYIVMEYLAGVDLSQLLAATGPLPVERATDLVLQACRGIQEAHKAGVIHRDLKPENLFVCRRSDGSDLVKIVDFGIAKLQASDAGNAVTRTGGMLGTPSYMSPEQARGDANIDPRSDVYSLGVILYQLLSGQMPHPGASYNAVIYHISTQNALPLVREGHEFAQGLVDLINRALSLRPEERLASAEALADELARFGRRVVWPKVEAGVLARQDPEPKSDAGERIGPGEPAGTSLGSTRDAPEPQRKGAAWRTPAVVATGLAILLTLLLSVRGLSKQKHEPENDSANTARSPTAPPQSSNAGVRVIGVESGAPAAAAPKPEEPPPAHNPAPTGRPGRPLVARGHTEGRPATSVVAEQPPARVKSAAGGQAQATFDPRNPYE